MAQDPYGYTTDEVQEGGDSVAPWITFAWMVGSAAVAAVCAGCGTFIGVDSEEPTALDKFGVGLLASCCAWPALGITIWSLVLHLTTKRWWAQAGPNVLLGAVTGFVVWLAVFCATAMVAGSSQ
jgi:hypothetical protein